MMHAATGCIDPARRAGSPTANAGTVIVRLLPRLAAAFVIAWVAIATCAASPSSVELERLRLQLEDKPTQELEVQYLQVLRKLNSRFRETFDNYQLPNVPDEGLYKTRVQHMALLDRLAAKHPRAVLEIWLDVTIYGSWWKSDTADMLRRQLAGYAAKETQIFATAIMGKTKTHDATSVVTFLADVESFSSYEDYATILANLEKLGQSELKTLFLEAKAQRMTFRRSPTSAEMERLRIQIETNPAPEAEIRYLALFPKTFVEFKKTFSNYTPPDVELYKTQNEHLRLLEKLAAKHPRAVLEIWLSVSANATYDADAVSFFRSQLLEYAAKETKTFAAAIMAKPEAQRRNIVTFLADRENFDGSPDYATILSNLEKLEQSKLRRLFLDAKAKRMKYRHAPGE